MTVSYLTPLFPKLRNDAASTRGRMTQPVVAHEETDMFTKTTAVLTIALTLIAVTSASARHHHRSGSTGYTPINSGYGPPSNWNEIEREAIGGNSN